MARITEAWGVVTHWPPQPESFNPFPGERSTVPQGKCKSEWEVGPPNGHHCLGMKVSLFKEHKFGLVENRSYTVGREVTQGAVRVGEKMAL